MTRGRSIAFLSLVTAGISSLYAAHGCIGTFDFVGHTPFQTTWWSLVWQSLWPWPPWIIGAPVLAWLAVRWSIVQRGSVRFLAAHLIGLALLLPFLVYAYQPWAMNLLVRLNSEKPSVSAYFEQYGKKLSTADSDKIRAEVNLERFGYVPIEESPPRDVASDLSGKTATVVPSSTLTILLWHLLYFALLAAINQGLLAFIEMGRQKAQNAELRSAVDRARLAALQKQLNPHFLFNVLNSICYIATREPQASRAMLLRLSALLRSSFDTGDVERPAAAEIELTRGYIELCRLRYGDRLRVAWNITPDLNGERLPSWCLQTLVENAVVHAVEKTAAPVNVEINIARNDAELCIEIADDGPGCNTDTGGFREGVGLGNLRQRLHHLYGDRGSLRIDPGIHGGFRVMLTVPQNPDHPPQGFLT